MIVKRILCPIDFSDACSYALATATRWCEVTGAELVLAHIYDFGNDRPHSIDFEEGDVESHGDPNLSQLVKKLDAVAVDPKINVHKVMHGGPAGEAICWLAQHYECGMIVIGTHGLTGLFDLMFGSVAEHVIKHARVPVLVVRKPRANEPPLREPIQPPPRGSRLI